MGNRLLYEMGERIYKRRKQLRMTQEELAEKADLTPQTISSAELGKKALRPENIIKVCDALSISTDFLLCGNITSVDHNILFEKVVDLPTNQYRYLENIVNSYIDALHGIEEV